MKIIEQIKSERDCGVVHCGFLDRPASPADVIAAFSLSGHPDDLHPVEKIDATQILTELLHKDMAYGGKIMPQPRAATLAEEFLAEFDDSSSQFLTNIEYHRYSPATAWSPMTEATCDAGIIAISNRRSGCLWVEDED